MGARRRLDTAPIPVYRSIAVMDVVTEGARYCGRWFDASELSWIRQVVATEGLHRAALARRVCDALAWRSADGRPKAMSCRVAMLRMERDGLIALPPPMRRNGNGRIRPAITEASAPGAPIVARVDELPPLRVEGIADRAASARYNELVERYHYLGYVPLAGAQLRYFAYVGEDLVAALGFGAAAWSLAPRDRFVGWDARTRVEYLHRVVGHARFLILPWVTSKNLASHLLSRIARQLPADWESRYGYRPVLLETCVERDRYAGTCYRAANWIGVGQTQGRGKCDVRHRAALPIKDVYLYPLTPRFRAELGVRTHVA